MQNQTNDLNLENSELPEVARVVEAEPDLDLETLLEKINF